ncbi:hypothetical protein [Telluribacter sp.]|jgi:hypothetical protein|uniref:hypothetical protein n=1 Tax=Telluribacter sp. TaxID=1978767 RepID=UPI002E15D981|nr:hypothetical protein [Telluribacter sp.]
MNPMVKFIGPNNAFAYIGPLENKPDLIHKAIEDLKTLQEGWDYGQGVPVSEMVVNKAKQIYSLGKLLTLKVEVMPKTNGGIILNFFKSVESDIFLEVTINPDLSLDYVLERGKGHDFETLEEDENVLLPSLHSKLNMVSRAQWNSLEPYTLENIQFQNNVLLVNASLAITAGYPSSMQNAPRKPHQAFANT